MNKLMQVTVLIALLMLLITGCAASPEYDSPPLTPINVAPVEQSNIVINAQTTFVWQEARNASYYEFHLYNNATSDIEQYARRNLRASDVCQNGQCSLMLTVALPLKKDHAWRVRAGNNVGLSEWSRTRFTMIKS